MKKPDKSKRWRQIRNSVRGSQKRKKIVNPWTGEFRYRKARGSRIQQKFRPKFRSPLGPRRFSRILKGWPFSQKKAH